MVDNLRMLVINPSNKISPKSSGSSCNKVKLITGQNRAKPAIGGKKGLSSKMLVA